MPEFEVNSLIRLKFQVQSEFIWAEVWFLQFIPG